MSLAFASARARPAREAGTAPPRAASVAELASAPRSSVPGWAVAAAAAVALHAGVALFAYAHRPDEASDPDLGAPAMAIGLDMEAPHTDSTDLPPGPEADDAAASTAQMEQKTKTDDSALPKDTPTETPDPDRVVAPDPVTEPKKDEPREKQQTSTAAAESVASEAAAPPPSEAAIQSQRSVAQAIGTGEDARRVIAGWQRDLVAHLDRKKRYPAGAPARSAEILVSFTIDRTGHVLDASVLKSSGAPAFDEAALAMVHRADPVPPPPPLVADEGLTFKVPVVFRLKGRR